MRFERLSIPAYGPFTDFALTFPSAGSDCHLIYGRNEAGKSSLLRAMRDLLYGIHGQTPDNFRHQYKHLRIAGRISNSAGQGLSFQRRKGIKNTLLDDAGNVLPDDALSAFLGVVDREFFSSMFGLGAQELREGAQALLHGQGELGQALFSASLAGTPVHRILDALDGEARILFDGRARNKVSVRPAVEAYNESHRLSRSIAVQPEAWEAALSELAVAGDARDGLDAELQGQRSRRDWLQRCLDALPTLGLLETQEQRLADLPATPRLDAAFVAGGEQALAARDRAKSVLQQLNARIDGLRTRVREHQPEEQVLARAAEIESLHQQLAVYRQWKTEQVALQTDAARCASELGAGMRQLGVGGEPAVVETLRVRAADELALRESASLLTQSTEALAGNELQSDSRQVERASLRDKLAALVTADVAGLRSALAETTGAAEAAKGLSRKQADVDSAARRLSAQHGLLQGAPADLQATFALQVPAAAGLRDYHDEAARLGVARSSAEAGIADLDNRLTQLQGALARLERRGALPSIEGLLTARQRRDQAWSRVLAAWKAGAEEGELDGKPLAEAYPLSVKQADAIADRLREDAETVAQAEELGLQIQEAQAANVQAKTELQRLQSLATDWQERWNHTWSSCGIKPGSPGEMLEWRDRWTDYRNRYEDWEKARAVLAAAQSDIDAALAVLAPLLPEVDKGSLPALRQRAERAVQEADEARGERRQLQAQIRDCDSSLQALAAVRPGLEEAADAARTAWQRQCRLLDLPSESNAESGLALLGQRRQLVSAYDALTGLRQQMERKQQAIDDYETAVNALADSLGIEPAALEVRENAQWQALDKARALHNLQAQAQSDLQQERALLAEAEAALADAQRQVADCQARSGADSDGALRNLLLDLQARHAMEAEIERLRQTLHVSARGEPLDDFIARVRAEPGDALSAGRDALDEAIANLQAQRDVALQRLANAQQRKRELEQSGAEASEHLQAARSTAVRIRHDASRYLRLRLAIDFLHNQIEVFRKQNQAPLLNRAGEIFAAVTQGSFEGLGSRFAEDDTPLLVGVRQASEVAIQGMSDGTRDQLYLALRLAAIEHHQQHHEPMPLILDDLLATFDDRRSRAILPILSDLGQTTQVMLFTHHRHLAELAREALAGERLHMHEL